MLNINKPIMYAKQKELEDIVKGAIDEFNVAEIYLLDTDLSERCICAKFATYLERALSNTPYFDYCVDVEYNRGMNDNVYTQKMLDGRNIVVDLVVHKRGRNPVTGEFDNLICIEMKKSGGECHLNKDKDRLQKLTNPQYEFNYRIGFMLIARKSGIVINDKFYNPLDL